MKRLQELRLAYPAHSAFFDDNEAALLDLMEDVRSEKELDRLRQSIETSEISPTMSYDYPSTSVFAVEDLLIDLLDFKRELFRQVGKFDRLDTLH